MAKKPFSFYKRMDVKIDGKPVFYSYEVSPIVNKKLRDRV